MATIFGTPLAEKLFGTAGNDFLYGLAGDDTVFGFDGHDVIFGGAGDDYLLGMAGDDVLFGEDGDDHLHGHDGNDYLSGGDGNDNLSGGDGTDFLTGGGGHDDLGGGDGDDTLDGGSGRDFLNGGAGADQMDGGAGTYDWASYQGAASGVVVSLFTGAGYSGDAAGDTLTGIEHLEGSDYDDWLDGDNGLNILEGEGGNDYLTGRGGNDHLGGGNGDDTLDGGAGDDVLRPGRGADVVDGGSGNDVVMFNYDTYPATLIIDLEFGRSFWVNPYNGVVRDETQILNVENAHGSWGDDIMNGNSGDNRLVGDAGDDIILGAEGDDSLRPGTGKDDVFGDDGDDRLTVAFFEFGDSNRLTGGDGADTFEFNFFAPNTEQGRVGEILDFDRDEDDRIELQYVAGDGFEDELIPVGADEFDATGHAQFRIEAPGGEESPYIIEIDGDGDGSVDWEIAVHVAPGQELTFDDISF